MNGKIGKVVEYNEKRNRYGIQLDSGKKPVYIKVENFQLLKVTRKKKAILLFFCTHILNETAKSLYKSRESKLI